MAEFVQQHLEELVPVFQLLQTVGLFSPGEVKEFVRRCRGYEYRLQKICKDPRDFLLYADYLYSGLKLVKLRRKKLNYKFKDIEIEGAIKSKIADVYKVVTLRFQGNKELWRRRLNFLKKENMRSRCSKAFFRAIQVLGNDTKLREEAALWEFISNKSIDNARLHLQLAIRSAPETVSLWSCFLKVEIMNVQRLIERRNVLVGEPKRGENDKPSSSGEADDDKDTVDDNSFKDSDPVMQFKLAELVIAKAMDTPEISDKNELLFALWRCAVQFKDVAKDIEKDLYDRFWICGKECEESWFAKYERDPNQDPYDVLDTGCEHFNTEKMLRYYIKICKGRILLDDAYAAVKLKNLLLRLHANGVAQIEDYGELLKYTEDENEKVELLRESIERFQSSSLLWSEFLRLKMRQASDDAELEDWFNEALSKVNPHDALIIYQLAIDWTVANLPSKTDEVFKRAMLLGTKEVASAIKSIRLRYCKVAYPEDPEVFRKEFNELYASPPNDKDLYETYIKLEMEMPQPRNDLILKAYEKYVADHGCHDYQCWIDYAKFLLLIKPKEVSCLYQRAFACIPKDQCDLFTQSWALMMENPKSLS